MADTRSLIMTAGAAVGAVALIIGGIAAADAIDVDDAPGEITATAGIGAATDGEIVAVAEPAAAPSATPADPPAPAVPPAAEPVVQEPPVDVKTDPASREKTRAWDDGDASNDCWWSDDQGQWHWGDRKPADPTAATPATPADPAKPADPSTGSGGWGGGSGGSGGSGGWGGHDDRSGGDRGGWDGGGHGGSGWGGGGSGGDRGH